jgi:hypothetical protein
MSKSTAIVESAPQPPAVEKIITTSVAIDIVRKAAADELRAAKKARAAKVAEIERAVGGTTKRLDDTVLEQLRMLMTRLALIAKQKNEGYGNNAAALDAIVKKLGGVYGELQAYILTDNTVGLFEQILDHEYVARPYGNDKNPLLYAGRKARSAAEAALDGYTIVDDPKPGKKGEKNVTPDASTGKTVAQLAADPEVEDDDDDVEDDDE